LGLTLELSGGGAVRLDEWLGLEQRPLAIRTQAARRCPTPIKQTYGPMASRATRRI